MKRPEGSSGDESRGVLRGCNFTASGVVYMCGAVHGKVISDLYFLVLVMEMDLIISTIF